MFIYESSSNCPYEYSCPKVEYQKDVCAMKRILYDMGSYTDAFQETFKGEAPLTGNLSVLSP